MHNSNLPKNIKRELKFYLFMCLAIWFCVSYLGFVRIELILAMSTLGGMLNFWWAKDVKVNPFDLMG